MPNIKAWFMRNRSWIGGGFLGAFFYLQANPGLLGPKGQMVIGIMGAWLHGAGWSKSDQFYRDREKQP